jgi:hypothetical protein
MAPRASSNLIQSIIGHCNCTRRRRPENPRIPYTVVHYSTSPTPSYTYLHKTSIITRVMCNHSKLRTSTIPLHMPYVYRATGLPALLLYAPVASLSSSTHRSTLPAHVRHCSILYAKLARFECFRVKNYQFSTVFHRFLVCRPSIAILSAH